MKNRNLPSHIFRPTAKNKAPVLDKGAKLRRETRDIAFNAGQKEQTEI